MTSVEFREQAARLTRRFHDARRDPDVVILEGFHALKHALRFGADVQEIVSSDQQALRDLIVPLAPELIEAIMGRVEVVNRRVFRQLGPYEPHTGVVSIAARIRVDPLGLLESSQRAPIILLDDPRHRGNLGAVIRVAAAAEAAGVITTGIYDPWDPVAVRGSAGLHFALPVTHIDQLPPLRRPLIAFDPEGDPLGPGMVPPMSILAFGSERHGLSEATLQRAERRVSLPMRAGISSLNLATSVAAVLYSLRLAGLQEPVSAGFTQLSAER